MTVAVNQPTRVSWWIPLVGGIAALIVAFFFFTSPVQASISAVLALGFWWVFVGILDLVHAFTRSERRGWNIFTGILGLLAGGVILAGFMQDRGAMTTFAVANVFVLMFGILGIMYGIMGLVAAFTGGGWAPGVLGALAVLFGFWILAKPLAATISLPWAIGFFLIFEGIFMIIAAFRLRSAAA